MSGRLPAVVIGGYLGAGKTTLVNHLLRHAGGRRIAVLVNDFGEVSIDAGLIESTEDGQVLALAGGCICCSYGADLVGTLAQVAARRPPPDLVLIETSGVALPASVARTARLAPGLDVEGIVVLADAGTLRAQASDRYVGDTVMQQLQAAQLLLLNKCDAVDAASLAATTAWLQATLPQAVLLPCRQAQVSPDAVLDLKAAGDRERAGAGWAAGPLAASGAQAVDRFVHQAWLVPPGTPMQSVLDALAARAGAVARAKGWLVDEAGRSWLLQAVGSQVRLETAGTVEPRLAGRVQLIGLRDRLPVAAPPGWAASQAPAPTDPD